LNKLIAAHTLVLDDGYRILREYQKKTSPNKCKQVGDVFVKWVLTHAGNSHRVHQVTLTETAQDSFAEFPVAAIEAQFDPPDRVFPSVANAHPSRPIIWQAVDCKWLDWWPDLHHVGVRIEFICPEDICRYYVRKFPARELPALP